MFSNDMTFAQWSQQAEQCRWAVEDALNRALIWQRKWYAYAYGKTDADIGTTLGRAGADITALQTAFNSLKSVHDIVHGTASQASPYDHAGTWAPF